MPVVTVSAPIFVPGSAPTGWTVKVANPDTSVSTTFTVYAICA